VTPRLLTWVIDHLTLRQKRELLRRLQALVESKPESRR